MSRNSLFKTSIYIWNLSDCNGTWTHSHLVCEQNLNHLASLVECSFANQVIVGLSPVAVSLFFCFVFCHAFCLICFHFISVVFLVGCAVVPLFYQCSGLRLFSGSMIFWLSHRCSVIPSVFRCFAAVVCSIVSNSSVPGFIVCPLR